MADQKRKPKAGVTRSEVFAMRLDPRLKYLAELAARKQRRSMANFVEWAIEDVLNRVVVQEGQGFDGESDRTFANAGLWDVDESTRFAKLALSNPELLTYDEQLLWKLVRENGWFWSGSYSGSQSVWKWEIREMSLLFERLRERWSTLKAVAAGEQPFSALPDWNRNRPRGIAVKPPESSGFEDDDIPF